MNVLLMVGCVSLVRVVRFRLGLYITNYYKLINDSRVANL